MAELYRKREFNNPVLLGEHYKMKAAEQSVITSKRNYYPSLSLNAEYLQIEQNIQQDEIDVFRQGSAGFQNQRVGLEFEQPLFDPSIRPGIDLGKARLEAAQLSLIEAKQDQLRNFIFEYLTAANLKNNILSYQRVLNHLTKQEQDMKQKFENQLATRWDIAVLRHNIVHTKRELSQQSYELNKLLQNLGISDADDSWGTLTKADIQDVLTVEGFQPIEASASRILKAEYKELEAKQAAISSKRLPSLQLIARYDFDNADDSLFGGAREITNYQVGIALSWDLFAGGRILSEIKEYEYLVLAKQAELDAVTRAKSNHRTTTAQNVAQSSAQVIQSKELMAQQKEIMETTAVAYEAGKDSYVNALDAFMLYESSRREYVDAQFNTIRILIEHIGERTGWDRDLLDSVDALFE
jgi:outer membrane protein TolC